MYIHVQGQIPPAVVLLTTQGIAVSVFTQILSGKVGRAKQSKARYKLHPQLYLGTFEEKIASLGIYRIRTITLQSTGWATSATQLVGVQMYNSQQKATSNDCYDTVLSLSMTYKVQLEPILPQSLFDPVPKR